ncbi:MAG TPA: aminotransferase class III-fold pyridoxal phosphate-dependent enzyme [Phycisphaerae bacterium]|nr:aminotransferase class III-fold pyridoxal phosphate-dependent enzyme [Phycisphaerae bacterium]HRY68366.1 aminotransferase class III-fold pyridoxal phosphate-dependent enzyme [Phycisphaerae bacterium]HSA28301.1 aminotransferase class III-fold pyridoxal phosphate-dependent enzyme [Phycisphaerae bacterium]
MNTRRSAELGGTLGPGGARIGDAMRAGLRFLDSESPAGLCRRVGSVIEELPDVQPIDKSALQDSYGGDKGRLSDDFLAGRGVFYLTEQRRLYLDCTAGHYQMLFGYNWPELLAAVEEAVEAGIVWDNHADIPQAPVKWLAHRLVAVANAADESERLDTVLLGVCTGSVACEAALKIQLCCWERRNAATATPALIVLDGHYHGTDMVPQYMRGMWKRYIRNLEIVTVEPNDPDQLERIFRAYGSRVAALWAEPILMNREALTLEPAYLQLARRWCSETGALMCVDEIQTGFWQPEVFAYRSLGFTPDMVIVGKGMTAGFHPLAAVIYRSRNDVLKQYDAINTNGSSPLASYLGLRCLEMIAADALRFAAVGDRFMAGLRALVSRRGDVMAEVRGKRHLAGIKFKRAEEAIGFHRRALAAGLWTRVHASCPGHSTVLMKLALPVDDVIVDYLLGRLESLLP